MAKAIEALVDDSVNDFAVTSNAENDTTIRDAIAYREAGGRFLSADEFKARIKAAIYAKDAIE
ncbi:hypothetical protein R80B4_00842 [Fibrobacteres bacterium R8-0-B4]